MAKPKGFANGFGPGFGVGRYHYELTPWEWATEGSLSFWRQPSSVVGLVDLRPLSAQAQAGGTPQGFAFVASMQPRDGVAIANALHFSEEPATALMQDAWQAAMGYRPQGATLLDLLWDQITNGSDPDGIDGPKPLLPGVSSELELHVGGHSLVKSAPFHLLAATAHADRVRTMLQRQYRAIHDHAGEQCCRVLDFWCEKYQLNKQDRDQWLQIVPPALRRDARLLPHNTTITDNFNRTDADPLGSSSEGWSWTEVSGDHDIVSNQVGPGSGSGRARAESALSSDDHYAQTTLVDGSLSGQGSGPAVRFAAAADTCYLFHSDGARIFKCEAGTLTSLTTSVGDPANGSVMRLEVNGSSIEAFDDGVTKAGPVTDTAISGNLRTGFHRDFTRTLDNFEAADLAVGGNTYNEAGVGGLVFGGSAGVHCEYSPVASGGVVLGGSAAPQVDYSVAPSGGVVLGGSAELDNAVYDETGSGGVVLGGSADVSRTSSESGSGGLALAGSADVQLTATITAAGGLILGGTALVQATYTLAASGGIVLGGEAVLVIGDPKFPGAGIFRRAGYVGAFVRAGATGTFTRDGASA